MRLFASVVVGLLICGCPSGVGVTDAGPPDLPRADAGQPEVDGGTCEGVDFQTNLNHCGACNHPCAYLPSAYAACVSGACQYTCLPGSGDCDHDLAVPSGNGCETQLSTSPGNCGACGTTCTNTRPNAIAACSAGVCSARCEPAYGDCNFDLTSAAGNGCETDLRTSATSCGECYKACSTTCTSSSCAGELAECSLFASQSPRPVGLATASDGTHSALAWWDFDNKGLWVALLGSHGQTVIGARRVLTVPTGARPALSFDGTSFVLGWSTATVNGLSLQRLSRSSLADEGALVQLSLPTAPGLVYGASKAGRAAFMAWTNTLASVYVFVWPQGQPQPDAPRLVSLPGTVDSAATAFAAVRDGFVLAWVAQKASPTAGFPVEKRLGTLRLAPDGTPGTSAIDATPGSLSLQNGVTLTSMGERALLVGVEGGVFRLRTLVLDETGAPFGTAGQFGWNVLVTNFDGSASAGGDSAGAWLLERAWAVGGTNELRFRRVDAAGQTVGIPKRISSISGQPALQLSSSGAAGALGLWQRAPVGVPGALIATAFVDANGQVNTSCLAP